jgi:hypothetical protein
MTDSPVTAKPNPEAKHRRAACACGQLSLAVTGEPSFVLACACTMCQRRTGSSFGVSAYFNGSQIIGLAGDERHYTRQAESGRLIQFHFCPICGSTLYWTGVDQPIDNGIGIAAGCFADPHFPAPQLIAWTQHQADWLHFPADIPAILTQRDRLETPR